MMPGPGSYTERGGIGKDAVSVSIRGRSKTKLENGIPGPGSYDSSDVLIKSTGKSQRFTQSKRMTHLVQRTTIEIPGPGMYEQKTRNESQKYTFGMKQSKKLNSNPGPGAYDAEYQKVRSQSQTMKFSNSRREFVFGKSKEESTMPGPGMYESSSKNET